MPAETSVSRLAREKKDRYRPDFANSNPFITPAPPEILCRATILEAYNKCFESIGSYDRIHGFCTRIKH